jgi:hypothetical protein
VTLTHKGKGAYGDRRPTHDQLYLADRLNENATESRLTPAAIQSLNIRFGVLVVTDALRYMRGFCSPAAPFPYLVRILTQQVSQ